MPMLLLILLLTTPITLLVQDAETGMPVAGVALAGTQADDTPWQAVSDASGQIRLTGTGAWVQITQATDPTGQALVFSANTADGALRLPLDGSPLGLRLLIEPGRLFVEPVALADPTVQARAAADAPAPTMPLRVPTPVESTVRTPTPDVPASGVPAWVGWLLVALLVGPVVGGVVWWLWQLWDARRRAGRSA